MDGEMLTKTVPKEEAQERVKVEKDGYSQAKALKHGGMVAWKCMAGSATWFMAVALKLPLEIWPIIS